MANQTTTEKGPDNNKRLALLEAGTSALALAIAAAGITLTPEHDPLEQAKAIVERWHGLAGQQAEIAAIVAATVGTDPAEITDLAEATKELIARMRDHIVSLEAQLAAATDQAVTAETVTEPAPTRGSEARALGPDAKRATRDKIALLLADPGGSPLELVFSDGTSEVMEFEPLALKPGDLQRSGNGYMLVPSVLVKGSGAGQSVDGAALLAGGKQISYCRFERPIIIPAGQARQFSRAIRFD